MKKISSSFFALALSAISFSSHADITLENEKWKVTFEAETLNLKGQQPNGKIFQISSGTSKHTVSNLRTAKNKATWNWDNNQYKITAQIENKDLLLSITATKPGTLEILNQPKENWGRGLIFPISEGSYISTNSKVWEDFLLTSFSEFNTTQDLSLPLWQFDHNDFSISTIVTNPFNNKAQFTKKPESINLTLTHEFTELDYKTPSSIIIHLDDNNLLAGSFRYKEHLNKTNKYELLQHKINSNPEILKIIGAPHTYLWGGGLIAVENVEHWSIFLDTLRSTDSFLSDIRGNLDDDMQKLLKTSKNDLADHQKKLLIRGFNESLNSLARADWQSDNNEQIRTLTERYQALRKEVALKFAKSLSPNPAHWGDGISIKTLQTLKKSGLGHLWIGLGEGWEGGLWHPEAIQVGVDAGYLIAPYDSYQTALLSSDNPSWSTAHLGKRAYEDCAIIQKNGLIKSGFQKSGRYTQPNCVKPIMQKRIESILAIVPFNSWFLDAYATGMVFDSYSPGEEISQAEYAEGNEENMSWVTKRLKIPLGSEDGNSTTSKGLLFAHGMQTPVIGWGDNEMQKDKKSAYFVGRWYPNEKPEIFFKTVDLKEKFKEIYFDPTARLPLYQSVFHGSIITTHHWLYDSLKLKNVHINNELTQLLYNVPPLYHLSSDSLKSRIPKIVRQNVFFRAAHERLATKHIKTFKWLSKNKLIQEITYSDGTRLIANFSDKPYVRNSIPIEKKTIAAFYPNERNPKFYIPEM